MNRDQRALNFVTFSASSEQVDDDVAFAVRLGQRKKFLEPNWINFSSGSKP
ncbi:hypothetical protein HanPSC8_Chr14g0628821 [Helianthus annuus]|nr:hypothetical protein HanPSC8_Chr14g0628821 [Helianthus annuus]